MNMLAKPAEAPRIQAPKFEVVEKYHVFGNTIQNCKYTFAWGKDANFLSGEYATNALAEIKELMNEVDLGHPHLTFKGTRDVLFLDPMQAVKDKAVADYIAAQKRAMTAAENVSTSTETKLNVANSTSVAMAASGSSSGDGAGAQVANTTVSATGATGVSGVNVLAALAAAKK